MPADRRKRQSRHEQLLVPRAKRQFAVHQNAVSELEVGSAAQTSGNDILAVLSKSERGHLPLKKKEKEQIRRDAFVRRLGVQSAPYSKSHLKRLRREAKDELSTDLATIGEAIAAVDARRTPDRSTEKSINNDQAKPAPGQISEGKHGSLTTNQRKQAFQVESLRHKLIMADHNFSANPFQTIRTHAQNTLVKRQT